MKIVGIDLSLASTGLALVRNGAGPLTDVLKSGPSDDALARLRTIRDGVISWASDADLAVIEGPSYSSKGGGQHERSGLFWLVLDRLEGRGVPVAVVPPSSLKLYATGRGNASKDQVLLATARRFPETEIQDNNAADALWLCAMGARQLGVPFDSVPALHVKASGKINWPVAA